MSQPKVFRAGPQHEGIFAEIIDIGFNREDYIYEGDRFVRFEAYAALQAENERLTDYLDRIDLAFGKADYEQALDILLKWRKERKDLP